MKIEIQEQKNWLKQRLKVELLTSDKANQLAIQDFVANKRGKGLENYLKGDAWVEDTNGGTKIYLVKDIKTGDIVFFFGLKAGLLYKAIGEDDYELTTKEREIINLCIEYRLDSDNDYTEEDVFEWYEDEPLNKDKLIRIIEEKAEVKLAAREDQNRTGDGVNILRVSKTFPGIVLTHFCKNEKCLFLENLSFPLGFYVFWEIIIEKVLEISLILGCKYLYLFAADRTEFAEYTKNSVNYIYADMYDEPDELVQTYKLVDYYKNELMFEEVQGMTMLKPSYDFECFSLIQPVCELLNNRAAAWIQHSDIDK